MDRGARTDATSSPRPLSVVVVGVWLRFPRGMATSKRVELVCRGLAESGATVRVLCLQAAERPPVVENTESQGCYRGIPFLYASGTPVRHGSFIVRRAISARGWVRGALCLFALRRRAEADVFYLSALSERLRLHRLFLIALFRLLRIPVLLEVSERPWTLRPDRTPAERWLSPLAGMSGAVVVSRTLATWARREAERLHRALAVVEVPILVDVDEWRPPESERGEEPPAHQTVLFAGSPVWEDTIRFLFASMGSVWRRFPSCTLVVTGVNPGQPEARWLLEMMEAGGLDERVEIAGYVSRDELRRRMRRASALLIPLFDDVQSRARFPTKLGEYLASGRPLVTSGVGDVPRYIRDGETGYVAPPGDAEAFALRVCAVLADPDRADEIGRAGRRLAEEAFDYRRYGPILHQALAEAAGRVTSARPAQSTAGGTTDGAPQRRHRRHAPTRRVLLATAALGNGGLERQLALLAGRLPPGWSALVWAVDDGPFHEVLTAAGVPVVVCPRRWRFDPGPAIRLWQVVQRWRPDVVHSWHWLSSAAALPVCRAAGLPFVDGSIRTGRPLRDLFQPRTSLLRRADVVVANSAAGLRAWHIAPAKGRVIYNAFDPLRLPLCEPRRDAQSFTVVMCGRMHPHKDFSSVIAAARLLSSTGGGAPRWRFLLVGDGPDRPRLEKAARDLVRDGVVVFVDAGLEVLPVVATADVGVLMTDPAWAEEGCSNAIMEYMACSLPVVCCASGGNREIVRDGVTGMLIPPGGVAELAESLRGLRADPALAAGMGAEGHRRFERVFALDRMVAQYVQVYDEARMRRAARGARG